jgi:short-subunit dehydrogenase
MEHFTTVLITGGSSGLGLELAKIYASRRYRILLVSKPVAELEDAAAYLKTLGAPDVRTFQQDLAKPGAAATVFDWCRQEHLAPDLVINNAGVGMYGKFYEMDLSRELEMMRLNLETNYTLTRLFTEAMLQKNGGKVVTIASQAAYSPSPYLAAYAATKAFLLHFYRAADYELRREGQKVRLIAVCPPPMRTGFAKQAHMQGHKLFNSWITVPVDYVARRAVRAIDRSKQGYIPGWKVRFATHILNRILPNSWKPAIVAGHLR